MGRMGRQGITGNARAQEQLRSAEKLAQLQRDADLKELLALPAGRRFFWDLIDRRCNAHGSGYSASGSEMYYLNGQRCVGIDLRRDLERVDFKSYARMMIESIQEAEQQRTNRESAESKAKTEDEADE